MMLMERSITNHLNVCSYVPPKASTTLLLNKILSFLVYGQTSWAWAAGETAYCVGGSESVLSHHDHI